MPQHIQQKFLKIIPVVFDFVNLLNTQTVLEKNVPRNVFWQYSWKLVLSRLSVDGSWWVLSQTTTLFIKPKRALS